MKNFDVGKNIVTLLPEWVSRANAKQRSGRAGRLLLHTYHENAIIICTFVQYASPAFW